MMPSHAPAFACDTSALDPAVRTEHFAWIRTRLPELIQAVHEVPNGLALTLPVDALPEVAVFVDRERRCCPFLRFGLVLEPGEGPLRLELTGPDGVTAFLRAEFRLSA